MIRFAQEEDLDDIINMCEAHAAYEKASYSREGKKEPLRQALFSKSPRAYCLIAEVKGQIVGYATYTIQYSTWDADQYIYMDCLYLKEESRGLGLGVKFINKIKEDARRLNCFEIQWHTPSFNVRAIKFYHRIGAVSKTKERFFLDLS